jgi:enamine deaminase RidA (YjgF/YER057c/UK114 family)
MGAEARLNELGITLPAVPKPIANYLPYRLAGNLLFLSGQGPRDEKGNVVLNGKLGDEIRIDEGHRRARLIGLGLFAANHDPLSSLARVARPSSDHSRAYILNWAKYPTPDKVASRRAVLK